MYVPFGLVPHACSGMYKYCMYGIELHMYFQYQSFGQAQMYDTDPSKAQVRTENTNNDACSI